LKFVYPQSESSGFFTRSFSKSISFAFWILTSVRNLAYDVGFLPQRMLCGSVVSIGNVSVGGTGKTPVVIALVKKLQCKGFSPVVLTRGYGSSLKSNEWIVLMDGFLVGGNARPSQLPDEARLQSVECPGVHIIAGSNRFNGAMGYLETVGKDNPPTHWVLDDGFQHRRIRRNFDLVLMDKANPIGDGWLLPFGFLREPVSSLRRATYILLTGNVVGHSDVFQSLLSKFPALRMIELSSKSEALDFDVKGSCRFSEVCQKNILVVVAIARPERIFQDLKSDGIVPKKKLCLPDHHIIDEALLADWLDGTSAIITTAKDYWRNPEVFTGLKIPVFVKKIEIILPDSLVSQLL